MTVARLFLANCLIWLLTLTSTAAEASRVTTVGCIGSSGFGCAAASSCANGLGCIAAAGLATHGADIAGHGVVQLWTGEVTDTFGGGLLQQAGLSQTQAELVYGFMGAGIEIVALQAMLHAPATITAQALATYQRTGVLPEGVAPNRTDWPELSGSLREAGDSARAALDGKGPINFGMGTFSRDQTVAMGEAWVGPGYRVTSLGFYESADGLRQFSPNYS